MSIATALLAELQVESFSTIRVLERVPREHRDWRPHAKSMALGQLAWHIAGIPRTVMRLLEAGEFDLANARPAGAPPDDANPVDEYKRNIEAIRERIGALDDATMRENFTLRRGDRVLQTIPKAAVLRNIFMNHSIHHRGQLTVYLRMLDVPLPAVYGSSADEIPQ
jgi:uncharacterized damage-inducible protein DinB